MEDLGDDVAAIAGRYGVPGVAVGLLHEDEPHVLGVGVTSVEDPLPIDGRTLFQVGSISKTFTSTLVARLVERGTVALDDPVRAHVPGFTLADGDVTERVTVLDLLTHRGGWDGDWTLTHPRSPDPLAVRLADLAEARQLAPPGALFSYNQSGFSVLGRLVELAYDRPFEVVLRDELLQPLDLTRTGTTADEAVTRRVAVPHAPGSEGRPIVARGTGWQSGWQMPPLEVPGAGVISCADDLLIWARWHLSRQAPEGMTAPRRSAGGFADEVGLGWFLRMVDGEPVVLHPGQTSGYLSEILLVPRRRAALVVLTNAVTGWAVVRDVRRLVLERILGLRDHPPARSPRPQAEEYAGRYDHPMWELAVAPGADGEHLVLSFAPRADLLWAPPPPPPVTLAFYDVDRVVATGPDPLEGGRGEFGRDERGAVAWLRWTARIAPRHP